MVTQTWLEAAAYPNPADAQAAVDELKSNGFDESLISIVYTDAGHNIKAGLISGAIWGGVLGALFGFLFPPVGLLIAAGPIVGILASGASLAAAGALTLRGGCAADEVQNGDDHGDDDQNVDEPRRDVKSDQPEKPQDQQDDGNREQHFENLRCP